MLTEAETPKLFMMNGQYLEEYSITQNITIQFDYVKIKANTMTLNAFNEYQTYSTVWNISSTYTPRPNETGGLNLKTVLAIALIGAAVSSVVICLLYVFC